MSAERSEFPSDMAIKSPPQVVDGLPGEHEQLRTLIARLREVQQLPVGAAQGLLAETLAFARSHAQNEEAVMAAVSYPALNEHRAAHEEIARNLNRCLNRVQAGDGHATGEAIGILETWLGEHFSVHDLSFQEYLVAFVLRRLHQSDEAGSSAAQAEQERFRAILEAAPNALLVIDQDGCINLVNTQLERMYGYNRLELLGRPVEILIPERYRATHGRRRADFLASPEGRAMGSGLELFGLRKDGTEVPVEIGLSPLHTTNGHFVLASIIDISKRKEAESVMRVAQADALRDSILRSLPASVVACDASGAIVSVNPAAERLLGFGREELLG